MSALIGWSSKETLPIANVATAFDRIREISLKDWKSHNICDKAGTSIFGITFPIREEPRLKQVLSRVNEPPYSIRVYRENGPNSLVNWLTIRGMVSGGETVERWARSLELDLLSTSTLLSEITSFDGDISTWDAPAGTCKPIAAAIVGFITDFLQGNRIAPIEGVGDGERFIVYMAHQTRRLGTLEQAALTLIEQPYYICSAFVDPLPDRTVLLNSYTTPRDTPYLYARELRNGMIYASRPEMVPTGASESVPEPLPTGSVVIYPDHNNSLMITDHE